MNVYTSVTGWFKSHAMDVTSKHGVDVVEKALKVTSTAISPLMLPLKVFALAIAFIARRIKSKKQASAVAASIVTRVASCNFRDLYEAMAVMELTPIFLVSITSNVTVSTETALTAGCGYFVQSYSYAMSFDVSCFKDKPKLRQKWEDALKMILLASRMIEIICADVTYRGSFLGKAMCEFEKKKECLEKLEEEMLPYGEFTSNLDKLLQSKKGNVSMNTVTDLYCKSEYFGDCVSEALENSDCSQFEKTFNIELDKNGTHIIEAFCKKYQKRECASDISTINVIHPLVMVLSYLVVIISRAI